MQNAGYNAVTCIFVSQKFFVKITTKRSYVNQNGAFVRKRTSFVEDGVFNAKYHELWKIKG